MRVKHFGTGEDFLFRGTTNKKIFENFEKYLKILSINFENFMDTALNSSDETQ